MPANKKAFDLMGDDIVDLSTGNDALEIKIGSYEDWGKMSKRISGKTVKTDRWGKGKINSVYNVKTDEKTLNELHKTV